MKEFTVELSASVVVILATPVPEVTLSAKVLVDTARSVGALSFISFTCIVMDVVKVNSPSSALTLINK